MQRLNKGNSVKKAWFLWLLASAYFFYEFFIRVSPSVLISYLTSEFGMSPAQAGQLTAIYFYTFVLMQIPAGLLMDRFGERWVMTSAAMVLALGNLCFAMSTNLVLAEFSRLLMGLGASFSLIGALKIVSSFFPERLRGLPVGLIATAGVMGATISQNLLPQTLQIASWREHSMVLSCIGVGFAFCFWTFYPRHTYVISQTKPPLRRLLKQLDVSFVGFLGLYAGLVNAPTVAFAAMWGVPYLIKAYHMSAAEAARMVSFVWVGQIAGSILVGWLCDRLNPRSLMLGGALGAFCSMSLIIEPALYSISWLVLGMLALGVFCSANYVAFAVVAKGVAPELTGLTSGTVSTLNIAVGTVLQLIISFFVNQLVHDPVRMLSLTKMTLIVPLLGVPLFLLVGMLIPFLIKMNKLEKVPG